MCFIGLVVVNPCVTGYPGHLCNHPALMCHGVITFRHASEEELPFLPLTMYFSATLRLAGNVETQQRVERVFMRKCTSRVIMFVDVTCPGVSG